MLVMTPDEVCEAMRAIGLNLLRGDDDIDPDILNEISSAVCALIIQRLPFDYAIYLIVNCSTHLRNLSSFGWTDELLEEYVTELTARVGSDENFSLLATRYYNMFCQEWAYSPPNPLF